MPFVAGHELSRALLDETIAPLMRASFPRTPYAAALIGSGSDVLGYDTARSMDHDWGPRLNVVLREEDAARRDDILDAVERTLPETVRGVPIDLEGAADVPGGEVRFNTSAGRTRHHGVMVDTASALLRRVTGIGDIAEMDPALWLTTPQQSLLEFTAGPMFADGTGQFTAMRRALHWFPDDIWYVLMAAQWQRIAQLEPFIGRAGEAGDDPGSQIIATTILRDVMRLALLQHRRYAPYAKWLGSAFARLPVAGSLLPAFDSARFATDWRTREGAVVEILLQTGRTHDALGVTPPVAATARSFFDRPYQVLFVDRFADALRAAVRDPAVRALPRNIGGIDTITDSTLALADRGFRTALATWLRTPPG